MCTLLNVHTCSHSEYTHVPATPSLSRSVTMGVGLHQQQSEATTVNLKENMSSTTSDIVCIHVLFEILIPRPHPLMDEGSGTLRANFSSDSNLLICIPDKSVILTTVYSPFRGPMYSVFIMHKTSTENNILHVHVYHELLRYIYVLPYIA